ncbi:MAG TPA: alpha/beta family hydrolase [Alphaproteobacteria bacterium]
MTDVLVGGPGAAAPTLVLAHGAGAPMDSPFMTAIAAALARRGVRVARFEFPYMRARRAGAGRRPPDRQPVLLDAWREACAKLGASARLVVGGKSMGGRMASLIADEVGAAGLVCLGYPFHPPGRRERTRTAHLEALATPALIVQGSRDPFGDPEDVTGYRLSPAIAIHWIADGDHDLKPRKASGRTHADAIAEAADAVTRFVDGL